MNPILVDEATSTSAILDYRLEPLFLDMIPHEEYIQSYIEFAEKFMQNSEIDEALYMFQNAIDWIQETEGTDSIDLVPLLEAVAGLYRVKNEFSHAANLYPRIFCIAAKALGSNHPKLADILEDYSILLMEANQEIQSAIIMTRAKAIRLFGPTPLPVRNPEEDLFSADELDSGYDDWKKAAVS